MLDSSSHRGGILQHGPHHTAVPNGASGPGTLACLHQTPADFIIGAPSPLGGERARAKKRFLELCGQIATCHDIVPDQRYQLIRVYKANFERDLAVADELRGVTRNAREAASRGAGTGPGPCDAVERTAIIAHKAGAIIGAVDGLLEISRHWDQIPFEPRREMQPVTEEVLRSQLSALEALGKEGARDPVTLADALALADLGS